MKYTTVVTINKSIGEVIALFDSFENLTKWQPELKSYEHLSGTQGEPGAKTKMVYQHGKRKTEMIETIKVRNLPEEFSATYETRGVINHMYNTFSEIDSGTTKWITESEFIFSGFMKIFSFLFKGSMKKMTQKIMNNFKSFAESE